MSEADSYTPDEIVDFLSRSSLPSLLVEGSTDMGACRKIAEECGVAVYPCGGRKGLLKVFAQRERFSQIPSVFLADRDLWLFSGVPEEYGEIVLTKGYSLENDILASSVVFDFFNDDDYEFYEKIKRALTEWWSFEVESKIKGESHNFKRHIRYILGNIERDKDIAVNRDYYADRRIEYPAGKTSFQRRIASDFEFMIRGHQLEQALELVFDQKEDGAKELAKGILCMCYTIGQPPAYICLIDTIRERFRLFGTN